MPTPTVGGSTTGVNPVTNGTADGGTNEGHIKTYTFAVTSGGAQTVSVTETGSHDEEKCMTVYVLSGVDTTTPVDAAANFATATGNANQDSPSVSPPSSDAYLICHNNSGGGSATASYTSPGSMAEQYELHQGGLSGVGATEQLAASGATGVRTFVAANSIPWATVSVAMKTASGAAAPNPAPPVVAPSMAATQAGVR
jgi:hypothetical protein